MVEWFLVLEVRGEDWVPCLLVVWDFGARRKVGIHRLVLHYI